MKRARIALAIGVLCISIFPVLVKLNYAPGVITAFYRMAIASALILPYVIITKKIQKFRAQSLYKPKRVIIISNNNDGFRNFLMHRWGSPWPPG